MGSSLLSKCIYTVLSPQIASKTSNNLHSKYCPMGLIFIFILEQEKLRLHLEYPLIKETVNMH